MRKINPHISNPDRIYPGEKVLIPETLHELVPENTIWQNAFSRIPPSLESPDSGHAQLFLAFPGTTIDSIAENMFAKGRNSSLPLSTKRAILIHIIRIWFITWTPTSCPAT
jgi:hypothetical protein